MHRDTIRWLMGGLGTLLALVFSSAIVRGDYTPPSQAGSLLGEVFAFVGDFGSWNASQANLPVEFLAMTPAAEQVDAVVVLFWLWLHDLGIGQTEKTLPSSPPSSGNPVNSPTGSIIMGQPGNDPPSLHSNGGDDPPSLGGNGGISSLLGDPPSPSGGGSLGQQLGSYPPLGGSAGDSGGTPLTPGDPAAAPTSFMLLAVGGAGLLIALRRRRRCLA